MTRDMIVILGKTLLKAKKIKISDAWVNMNCPFAPYKHYKKTDNRPSFGISISNPSSYHCFSCGSSGSLYYLPVVLKWFKHPQAEEIEAFIKQHEVLGVSVENNGSEESIRIMKAMSEDIIKNLPIPSSWKLLTHKTLQKFEIRTSKLDKAIVFPIRDWYGRLVAVKYRFKNKSFKEVREDKTSFKSAGVWYGIHLINKDKPIYLVEGERDAMYLTQIGVQAIASCGASISKAQIDFLNQYKGRYIAFFDNDAPGQEATNQVCRKVKNCIPILYPPNVKGKDPAELVEKGLINLLIEIHNKDLTNIE